MSVMKLIGTVILSEEVNEENLRKAAAEVISASIAGTLQFSCANLCKELDKPSILNATSETKGGVSFEYKFAIYPVGDWSSKIEIYR